MVLSGVRTVAAGRVALEVDGARWRVVPAEVATRLGLASGVELDRPLLRMLARELRRNDAVTAATRAVARRPRSRNAVAAELERKRIRAPEREAAVALLERYGAIDDEWLAEHRARLLAGRGAGDAMILADLERSDIAPETARAALDALPCEDERARRIVEARGRSQRTARYLALRGFGPETVVDAVANDALEE